MGETVAITIAIQKALHAQIEAAADALNITPDQWCEHALEAFMTHQQAQPIQKKQSDTTQVNQGDIYWVQSEVIDGVASDIPHPHVVLQADELNNSRIATTVICAMTSNVKRTSLPGNVLLEAGEANLPKQSIVESSKVSTVPKTALGPYIGTLSEERVAQILAGLKFLQSSFFA